ncbi:MAG: hypothetical protein FWB85_11565 [Chitinispirillia bacterium]|nr:hypothetical protein [Chitinispirillia bacterium]MCL2242732.1 hypothetical protein [Chitinispirillia bacterium]
MNRTHGMLKILTTALFLTALALLSSGGCKSAAKKEAEAQDLTEHRRRIALMDSITAGGEQGFLTESEKEYWMREKTWFREDIVQVMLRTVKERRAAGTTASQLENTPVSFRNRYSNHVSKYITISTAAELAELANLINGTDGRHEQFSGKTITLTADIDLSDYPNWEPIGRPGSSPSGSSMRFHATFDGGGHVIRNLTIGRPDSSAQGLFGMVSGGGVKNLGLEGVSILGKDDVGGVAGKIAGNAYVRNCYVTGSVSGKGSVGGVVGYVGELGGTVEQCSFTGTVTADDRAPKAYPRAGGVVGHVYAGKINRCYSAADVTATARHHEALGSAAGGITASSSDVTNCYSTGTVSAPFGAAAGIAATMMPGGDISYCAALNTSVSGKWIGRITTASQAHLSNNAAFSEMKNSANALWGSTGASRLDGDNIDARQIAADGTLGDRFKKEYGWTTEKGKLPGFGAAVTMPIRLRSGDGATEFTEIGWYINNRGAQRYNISTAKQLAGLAELVNNGIFTGETIVLTGDIDLSPYGKGSAFNRGMGWVPIGTFPGMFSGTFDGGNKRIRGLYINDPTLDNAGLFGYVTGASLINIGVTGADITARDNVGGIAGYFDGNDSNENNIVNSYSTGSISGRDMAGGIAGSSRDGSVLKSYSSAAVSGRDMVGGIVGTITSPGNWGEGMVKGSYSTGAVTGRNSVGGIAGEVNDLNLGTGVGDCYSTGAITGEENVGGILGVLIGSGLSTCYSTGAITGTQAVGGIVGFANNGEPHCRRGCDTEDAYSTVSASVTNCAALNPSVNSDGAAGRIVGKIEKGGEVTIGTSAAFNGLKDRGGRTNRWAVKGPSATDGADITKEEIGADGTIGGRFTAEGEGKWTTGNGKLPGLGGKTVETPRHLR